MARLKTFIMSTGLKDYVVAATSRTKALAAWGARQDLFKTGLARETDEPALVEAAAVHPGDVIERSADGKALLAQAPQRKAKPRGPTKAQREKVTNLEADLERLDADFETAATEREAALDRLRRQDAEARERYETDRDSLAARLRKARQALR
jgi:hypothetical protein